MGEDGHFASLFPDAANLREGLAGEGSVIDIRTAASPHPRRSLTLARLLATDCLLLLAFGEAKRAVLENPGATPVATLLGQGERPLEILWAP
jgi:6-phosphogluconolactonase